MANIEILDNATIHDLLINLSREEAIALRKVLEQTFEDVSVGGERQYQPMPSVTNRANGQNTLFRPFTSDSSVGAKIVVEPAPGFDGKKDPLHGIIVLTDGKGNLTAILSSEEVTGYRTSMNAMVPFCWRKHVDNIVIFGGGMQALWHTRLILTLRGLEVQKITYASPGKDRVDRLIATVTKENQARWNSNASFHFIDTTATDYQRDLQALLKTADAIFCTTPSKKPLFPASYLTQCRIRQPFISAIGSWLPDMVELDQALLHHAISASDGYNSITRENRGVVLVDDRDFALQNCGELVNSGILARDVVELGEIIALKKGKGSPTQDRVEKTTKFISESFIVYKSVGVSLTDLTASNAILELAKNKLPQQQSQAHGN
ncbi:Ornithine cyclodeaminase/mu-crystallin [Penicillium expansum]|uniref:Ornithine cyclodeaminase/mu-crystallin n=1 Tax=Penicillium expansum TaxID=27334 RepID=A0A0A2JHI9_PENEN|nr:Ornithine cyclodeaminase/mu-crystallin [Penicillium expansum]KGO54839.1 Ornithine cyclodeaminase/mu-crystallin [Penicillium expansum]